MRAYQQKVHVGVQSGVEKTVESRNVALLFSIGHHLKLLILCAVISLPRFPKPRVGSSNLPGASRSLRNGCAGKLAALAWTCSLVINENGRSGNHESKVPYRRDPAPCRVSGRLYPAVPQGQRGHSAPLGCEPGLGRLSLKPAAFPVAGQRRDGLPASHPEELRDCRGVFQAVIRSGTKDCESDG